MSADWFLLILSAAGFVYSYIYLYDPDRVWGWHVKQQTRRGISEDELERDEDWERLRVRNGRIGIGLSVVIFVAAFFLG